MLKHSVLRTDALERPCSYRKRLQIELFKFISILCTTNIHFFSYRSITGDNSLSHSSSGTSCVKNEGSQLQYKIHNFSHSLANLSRLDNHARFFNQVYASRLTGKYPMNYFQLQKMKQKRPMEVLPYNRTRSVYLANDILAEQYLLCSCYLSNSFCSVKLIITLKTRIKYEPSSENIFSFLH